MNQIEKLALDLENQFIKIGEDLKNQMLKDYNNILQNDLSDVKSYFESYLLQQNNKILSKSQKDLEKSIKQQLSNVFVGNISGVFKQNKNLSSDSFNESTTKNLFDLGKAISRISSRNG